MNKKIPRISGGGGGGGIKKKMTIKDLEHSEKK